MKFFNIDLVDDSSLNKLFVKYKPQIVVNLAAQAGVRYSIKNPKAYTQSNLLGFTNIWRNAGLEELRVLFMHLVVQFMVGIWICLFRKS